MQSQRSQWRALGQSAARQPYVALATVSANAWLAVLLLQAHWRPKTSASALQLRLIATVRELRYLTTRHCRARAGHAQIADAAAAEPRSGGKALKVFDRTALGKFLSRILCAIV